MKAQVMLFGDNKYLELFEQLKKENINNILIVCGKNTQKLDIYSDFIMMCNRRNLLYYLFDDFEANPHYNSVKKGVEYLKRNKCDAIIVIGGGSAIDVGKCIKMFSGMTDKKNYLLQEIKENNIILIALPTTAGTGAESTKFAVIYNEGNKYSVNHICGLPNIVVLEPKALDRLPEYHRKVTALDVLAHGIESYWSVNSTEESREMSKEVVRMFFSTYDGYLKNDKNKNESMLLLANLAGKAINITYTTGPHALSYKISSDYNIAHGHAVGLCLPIVFRFMMEHLEKCQDIRGTQFVSSIFSEIALTAGYDNINEFIERIEKLIITEMQLDIPYLSSEKEIEQLISSVNEERLKNNPIKLDENDLRIIYKFIFDQKRRW